MRLAWTVCLALALAACGSVEKFNDAGGGGDGGHDAATDGTVDVTTYTRCCSATPNTGQAGVHIQVTHADNSLGPTATSDASGNAQVTVHVGDSVTAIYRDGTNTILSTYTQVKPGDHLTFGDQFAAAATPGPTLNFSWPTVANASTYRLYFGNCSNASQSAPTTTLTYQFDSNCHSPIDVYFVALDASGAVISSGRQNAVPLVDQSNASLNTWAPAISFTVGATGLPAQVTNAIVEVGAIVDGQAVAFARNQGTPSNGALAPAVLPFVAGEDSLVSAHLLQRSAQFGPQIAFDPLPTTATSYTDASPVLLPWYGTLLADAGAEQVTWILDGTGAYDVNSVQVRWSRFPADGANESYTWNVYVPSGVDHVTLPALGGADAALLPAGNDNPGAIGILFDVASAADYDAIRALPEWQLAIFNAGVPTAAMKVSLSVGAFGKRAIHPFGN